jgi:hypothetical protein
MPMRIYIRIFAGGGRNVQPQGGRTAKISFRNRPVASQCGTRILTFKCDFINPGDRLRACSSGNRLCAHPFIYWT